MQRILMTMLIAACAITAHAAEDSDGYRIIKNGDHISLAPASKMFVTLQDLQALQKAADNLKSLADGRAMNEGFQDLVNAGRAYEAKGGEAAVVLSHNDKAREAKIKVNGLVLWIDESDISTE